MKIELMPLCDNLSMWWDSWSQYRIRTVHARLQCYWSGTSGGRIELLHMDHSDTSGRAYGSLTPKLYTDDVVHFTAAHAVVVDLIQRYTRKKVGPNDASRMWKHILAKLGNTDWAPSYTWIREDKLLKLVKRLEKDRGQQVHA